MATENYRGRFAPSPTGPLHFGSLLTALASFLDARHHQGKWLVRIEDLDPPREKANAADQILNTLELYNLYWDESVVWQSQRQHLYEDICQQLISEQKAFYCTCSRSQLSSYKGIYPGTCRKPSNNINKTPPNLPYAIRFKTNDKNIYFKDRLQGVYKQNVLKTVGDFVIKRKDGLFAYQLAVVFDDHEQKINQVVRGYDLIDNTPRQISLQQCLDYAIPAYAHLPIIVNKQGQKLSKQSFASSVPGDNLRPVLLTALKVLGYSIQKDMADASVNSIIDWAIKNWSLENIPRKTSLLMPVIS